MRMKHVLVPTGNATIHVSECVVIHVVVGNIFVVIVNVMLVAKIMTIIAHVRVFSIHFVSPLHLLEVGDVLVVNNLPDGHGLC